MRELSIGQAKKAVKAAVKTYLLKNEEGLYEIPTMQRLPIYLEGPVGIGKTEMVEQVARETDLGFVSYSITHHTRNSLLGLPVIRELTDGRKYTEYTVSEVIAAIEASIQSGKEEGILLLDEFNCMSDTVMPIMLSFLQNKKIGEHKLPDGWILVLCGNPSEYNKSARAFDMATLDRVRKIQVVSELEDYLDFATKQKIHPAIIDYLKINRNHFYQVKPASRYEEAVCVTSRSWSNLSKILYAYERMGLYEMITESFVEEFIKETQIARNFFLYYDQTRTQISMEEMERLVGGTLPTETLKRIVNRIYQLPFPMKWKLEETIWEYINSYRNAKEREYGSMWGKKVSEGISNVYQFLDQIDESHKLSHRFTENINSSKDLLIVVTDYPVPEYDFYIMEHYDVS